MDRLCELIDRFNLKYLIDSLPNGLDTIVEKSGASFSGGEKQRLLLIRTLLLESRILVFDEPTSALDLENERIDLFDNPVGYLTSPVISRLSGCEITVF